MATKKLNFQPAKPEMTEEQRKQQIQAAILQKKASLAEGIILNLCQGIGLDFFAPGEDPDAHIKIVRIADEMATEFLKVVYHQNIVIKEDAE